MKGISMIAFIDPAARPVLTVGGIIFITFYVLFGVLAWRRRREWFGADASVEGDRRATRYLQVMVICIPLILLAGRVFLEVIGIWTK
jgi:arginine exporter protein ArgO